MVSAKVFVPGDPPRATMQQKGERVVGGHVIHYTKKRQREAIAYWKRVGLTLRDKIGGTLKGPVQLFVYLFFRHPSGTPKAKRDKFVWRAKRPDADNLLKGLIDGLTESGLWEDDAQIVSLSVCKYNAPEAKCGTEIRVMELDEDAKSNNWVI